MFKGNFTCNNDVVRGFSQYGTTDEKVLDDVTNGKILFAWYGDGDYCGQAFVLFERGGQLYEVNAGHCSCYGLEGQWDPEKTSVEALHHRLDKGQLGQCEFYTDGVFNVELKEIINQWATTH